jgi:hypothetical protein
LINRCRTMNILQTKELSSKEKHSTLRNKKNTHQTMRVFL